MSATASCCLPTEVVSQNTYRLVLAGNPNGGKTTLFNALTGLRAQTANYPGTTVERRVGHFTMRDETIEIIDLPGFYDLQAISEEERVAVDVITGRSPKTGQAGRSDCGGRRDESESEPVPRQPDYRDETPGRGRPQHDGSCRGGRYPHRRRKTGAGTRLPGHSAGRAHRPRAC